MKPDYKNWGPKGMVCGLSGAAMVPGMLPYLCIWLVARDLIADAPYDRAPVRQRGPDDLGRRIKKGSLSSVCTR